MTAVPESNEALQVPEEQSIPAGEEATLPLPLTVTESAYFGLAVNVAVTLAAPFIVTAHAPAPEQAPPQPVNVNPEAGVAARVTTVPALYEAVQAPLEQLMPTGEEVTDPDPATDTDSAY